jgi:DNA-binding beta-propeller fold protein YncE
VSKITPDGTSTIFGTTGDSPQFLVLDADSNVYITNRDSDNVSKITPAAPAPASTATPVPVGPLWLLGIMAGLLSLVGMSKFHKT